MGKVVCITEGRGKRRREPRRITPELLAELIAVYSRCVLDQKGKCPLAIFTKPLAWELNQALGIASDEDSGFRRHDEMCAARPLTEERFERED